MGVYAPIVDCLANNFEKSCFYLTKDEEDTMIKQSAMLFSPNSRGVSEACEGITMFCNLGNMWDKFGFTDQSMGDMKFTDYMRLKFIMSKEGEFSKTAGRINQSAPPTMITGAGGRASGKWHRCGVGETVGGQTLGQGCFWLQFESFYSFFQMFPIS